MTNFDAIFNGVPTADRDKLRLASDWLRQEYEIIGVDSDVLLGLLEVHLHGEDTPQHFGHPIITSTFGRALVQIVFVTGRWHLSFRKEEQAEFSLAHPKSEGPGSWGSLQNRGAVTQARQLLKTATLLPAGTVVVPDQGAVAGAAINDPDVLIGLSEGPLDGDTVPSSSYDILDGLDEGGRGTVTIDLGSLSSPKSEK